MHFPRPALVLVILAAASLMAQATVRADKYGGDKLKSSASVLSKTLQFKGIDPRDRIQGDNR